MRWHRQIISALRKQNKKVKGKLQKDSGFTWEVDYGALTPRVSETLGISGYFSITESSELTLKLQILSFTHSPPSWADVLHVGREPGGVVSVGRQGSIRHQNAETGNSVAPVS